MIFKKVKPFSLLDIFGIFYDNNGRLEKVLREMAQHENKSSKVSFKTKNFNTRNSEPAIKIKNCKGFTRTLTPIVLL